jgi:hypothetical protein
MMETMDREGRGKSDHRTSRKRLVARLALTVGVICGAAVSITPGVSAAQGTNVELVIDFHLSGTANEFGIDICGYNQSLKWSCWDHLTGLPSSYQVTGWWWQVGTMLYMGVYVDNGHFVSENTSSIPSSPGPLAPIPSCTDGSWATLNVSSGYSTVVC